MENCHVCHAEVQSHRPEQPCKDFTSLVYLYFLISRWLCHLVQVTEYQEKLKRKQDSFVQIQREKELQYQELTIKLEEQRVDKEQEIVSLKEQSQRLQGQLNFGHTAYAEFKEKKTTEVQKLEDHIKELENQVRTTQQVQ